MVDSPHPQHQRGVRVPASIGDRRKPALFVFHSPDLGQTKHAESGSSFPFARTPCHCACGIRDPTKTDNGAA